MKNEDVENMLNKMQIPEPGNIMQHRELKIPLLSYRRSSKAGLWLLLVPLVVAVTIFLKTAYGVQSGYVNLVQKFFAAIDNNVVLTYLIPLIFVGLPLKTGGQAGDRLDHLVAGHQPDPYTKSYTNQNAEEQ